MPKHDAQPIPSERDVTRLEEKHAELAARVAELDSRLSLTPNEAMELQRLKKQKLWTKDAIQHALQ